MEKGISRFFAFICVILSAKTFEVTKIKPGVLRENVGNFVVTHSHLHLAINIDLSSATDEIEKLSNSTAEICENYRKNFDQESQVCVNFLKEFENEKRETLENYESLMDVKSAAVNKFLDLNFQMNKSQKMERAPFTQYLESLKLIDYERKAFKTENQAEDKTEVNESDINQQISKAKAVLSYLSDRISKFTEIFKGISQSLYSTNILNKTQLEKSLSTANFKNKNLMPIINTKSLDLNEINSVCDVWAYEEDGLTYIVLSIPLKSKNTSDLELIELYPVGEVKDDHLHILKFDTNLYAISHEAEEHNYVLVDKSLMEKCKIYNQTLFCPNEEVHPAKATSCISQLLFGSFELTQNLTNCEISIMKYIEPFITPIRTGTLFIFVSDEELPTIYMDLNGTEVNTTIPKDSTLVHSNEHSSFRIYDLIFHFRPEKALPLSSRILNRVPLNEYSSIYKKESQKTLDHTYEHNGLNYVTIISLIFGALSVILLIPLIVYVTGYVSKNRIRHCLRKHKIIKHKITREPQEI